MDSPGKQFSVVYTNKAKCRDCYRCIRSCPVNAIKIADDQASVIAERCIACGICIKECPQEAKTYVSSRDAVLQMLDKGQKPAITIAPSFVVWYNDWELKRLGSALRQAGFGFVTETSNAAYHVSARIAEYINVNPGKKLFISSACPAVVNYIEKYYPALVSSITPVLSPAMAHGRMLKEKLGKETPVVFAGPCVAKKDEARRNENKDYIDAVLTFSELQEILEMKNINLADCEESDFDENVQGHARLYPVEGGLLKTAGFDTDMLSGEVVSVSGRYKIKDLFDQLPGIKSRMIIEAMYCRGGCINGPDIRKPSAIYDSRRRVLDYEAGCKIVETGDKCIRGIDVNYHSRAGRMEKEITDAEISKVLARTGKSSPENQLNCGACGYDSCRENAIAVIRGLAEPTMCIPYMRRLAEEKNDILFRTDPNGIIILDDKLRIQNINPAFMKMFSCSDAILGRPVSYLVDPDPFEELLAGNDEPVHRVVKYRNYNLVCHQIHYAIREDNHFVGIFVDITNKQNTEKELEKIKSNAIIKAQELLEHQTEMAQEMTRFLGENSARGEMLLRNLMDALDEEEKR